ncbi:hypothetical protein [Streptomyces sp. NPDC059564]|uniref:hypothetical protein n=1 Tax=Streptomyces sp. NPDC059564 TaxID=3346865 RepID=UPI0036745D0D
MQSPPDNEKAFIGALIAAARTNGTPGLADHTGTASADDPTQTIAKDRKQCGRRPMAELLQLGKSIFRAYEADAIKAREPFICE